jgi:hypothetical protein
MTAKAFAAKRSSLSLGAYVVASALAILAAPDVAHAQRERGDLGYVGNSYLQIPGVDGAWRGADYRDAIRVEAHYWRRPVASEPGAEPGEITATRNAMTNAQRRQGQQQQAQPQAQQGAQQPAQQANLGGLGAGGSRGIADRGLYRNVPPAPISGAGQVVLALEKTNPDLPALMERCRTHAAMPEVIYSVETDRYRRMPERGPMPAEMPRFFDYRLHNAQIVDCPVLEGASQQALVVSFDNIDWVNWNAQTHSANAETPNGYGLMRQNLAPTFAPAQLSPLPARLSGETRSWVVTWFVWPHGDAEQCPVMDEKPGGEQFYALAGPEQAARERAVFTEQGGLPDFYNGQGALRGPHRLDVTAIPGIIPDPGLPEPQTEIAEGLNLDGSNGRGDYRSEDGAITGIDNQLYRAMGCIPGFQRNGLITQYPNNQMRDGEYAILLEVAGIDDVRNDREIYLTLRYSTDAMAKNAAGSDILPDYTFHVANQPQYTHYFMRARGRIVDGAIVVGPIDHFDLNLGFNGQQFNMSDARMRLDLREDGTLSGVVAGYRDWREIVSYYGSGMGEFVTNYEVPGFYQAMRRNADGLRNPVTGEYDGISTAYHIDAVPAFVVDRPAAIASVERGAGGR